MLENPDKKLYFAPGVVPLQLLLKPKNIKYVEVYYSMNIRMRIL